MESTTLTPQLLPLAANYHSCKRSSALDSVESTATNASSRSRRSSKEWNVPAKAALLDLAEVHSHLERLGNECERIMAYTGDPTRANSRPLIVQAQRDSVTPNLTEEDHDDFCAELTTPSRSSSCLLSGAYSIQPASSANSLPEANFDSNGLGFFRDVGVDTLMLSGSEPIKAGAKVAKIEEAGNEGGLPWDC